MKFLIDAKDIFSYQFRKFQNFWYCTTSFMVKEDNSFLLNDELR